MARVEKSSAHSHGMGKAFAVYSEDDAGTARNGQADLDEDEMQLALMVHVTVVMLWGLKSPQLLISSVRRCENDDVVVPSKDLILIRELDLVKTSASVFKIPLLLFKYKKRYVSL